MPKKFTYADAGVNRDLRIKSKRALNILKETYRFSLSGGVIQLPYGNIFPFQENCYLDLVIEGIGTKVLVAQLAEKYDTIGLDGVAMAVNDVIRSGAKPLAIVDNIHAQVSDPYLIEEWMKGIVKGAVEAECIIPSGEIGDVAELIKGLVDGKGFDMVFATIGVLNKKKVISGKNIKPDDIVLGLKSSGVHSNGISLARKILFRQWGGKYSPYDKPDSLDKELVYEILHPTKIYVKPLLNVLKELEVKAAIHITGDSYLKFDRLTQFSKGIGFHFNNFKPQPIFEIIQETASQLGKGISYNEMFKTFNMGWGFAIIIEKTKLDKAINILEKAGIQAEQMGHITNSEGIKILYKNKRIVL
jgi:phosphoribosylformylglycinamidine cyclo-ligase